MGSRTREYFIAQSYSRVTVCLSKGIAANQVLAVAGIVVDAKHAQAAAFYRHFGFVDLPGSSERLLLPYALFAKR